MKYNDDTETYDPYITPAPQPGRIEWRLIIILMVMSGLLLCAFTISVRSEDHPLCDYFAQLLHVPNVSVAEWIGYPQGWSDMPENWDYESWTPLVGDTGILTRVSGQMRWLWAFRSLKEDKGHHDFCEHVLIVLDAP